MNHLPSSIAVVRGLVLVFASTQLRQAAMAVQPPQMLRWEIEATIISKDDALDIFPDVRLGDPVHGTLMYDAAREVSWFDFLADNGFAYGYEHPRWVEAVSMVIDNPRTGGETRFMKDVEGDWADIQVGNSDIEDWIIAAQSVNSPSPLFTGETPVVMVGLIRPPVASPSFDLPTELDLDDWPWAKLVFTDLFFQDVGATRLEAEIYSLTPVAAPTLPGDFNHDGAVNGADYDAWRSSFDSTEDLYADGSGNGTVDAADYIVWRKGLGGNSGAALPAAVPEPSTIVLVALTLLPLAGRVRGVTCGAQL